MERLVICDREKVIARGYYNEIDMERFKKLNYQIYDDSFEWIDGKTKHEVYNNNGKCALLTTEMQIIKIRDAARVKLIELQKEMQAESEKKIMLIEMNEWDKNDETLFLEKQKFLDNAIIDYANSKNELLALINKPELFQEKKEELKPIFEKYNIKI